MTGTNDVPVLLGGDLVLNTAEGTSGSVNAQVFAHPHDQEDTQTWTVADADSLVDGDITPQPADYTFQLDHFKVWRSPDGSAAGPTIFEDAFGDGNPPPLNQPSYGQNPTGSFSEVGGFLVLDSDNAGTTSGIGTATPFIGHNLTLATNTSSDPLNQSGLKKSNDFTVEGRFKLAFPDDLRESYGIRLSDNLTGVAGNDTLALVVRKGGNGEVQVQFRDFNPAADTVTNLASFILPDAYNDGQHSIALRLIHATGSDLITAGFDIINGGGQVVQTHTFLQTGAIFSGELWTRAQIVAGAPEITDSYQEGEYGTLSVDQFGNVSYALRNQSPEVNALAQGQVVQDEFDIVLTDQTGASATKHVVVKVTGVNDAPAVAAGTIATGHIDAVPVQGTGSAFTQQAQDYLTVIGPALVNGLGGASGFGESAVPVGDDNSTGAIDITSVFGAQGLNFFGTYYTSVYINTNGNITFGSSTGTYTPSQISNFNIPMIAAFWADVDTRGGVTGTGADGNSTGSNRVYYDLDTVNRVLTVTWDDVGYYASHTNKANAFQLQLVALDNGEFAIVYRYEDIQWTTGDASGGSNGLGGTRAHAGYSDGQGNFYEFAQSGTDQMLDLENTVGDTGLSGINVFTAGAGGVVPSTLTTSGVINFSDPDVGDTHAAIATFQGDGQSLGTFTLVKNSEPGGNGAGGQFAWTYSVAPQALAFLGGGETRVETFLVDITDGHGGLVQQFVTVTLEGVNDAPVVAAPIVDQSSPEDAPWSFQVPASAFSDVDGDTLIHSASLADGSLLPAWLIFNASTRTFSGTPLENFNGTIDLKVTASDGTASAFDTFTLAVTPVNDVPVVTNAIADQSAQEGTVWNFEVPANTFTDVDGALTYTAAPNNGGDLPQWLDFNESTRTFSGTVPVDTVQSLDIKVTASDGTASASDTFKFNVFVLDDFDTGVYDGWTEFNDDYNGATNGSPTQGDIQIAHDSETSSGNLQLMLTDDDNEFPDADLLQRTLDLSGTTSATLSFDFRRVAVNDPFYVEVSTGSGFTPIENIGGPGSGSAVTDSDYQTFTLDLPPEYISATTTIRFSVGDEVNGGDIVYVDNFKVAPTGILV